MPPLYLTDENPDGCHFLERAAGLYTAVGFTASGAPYYRRTPDVAGADPVHLFWDPSCDGTASPAAWTLDDSTPSTTAASDLDGDGMCHFSAYLISAAADSPPLGASTWHVFCHGSFSAYSLTM